MSTTAALSQDELNRKTLSDGERITKLEAAIVDVRASITTECNAVRREIGGNLGTLEHRMGRSEEKAGKIDKLTVAIERMTERFANTEDATQRSEAAIANFSSTVQISMREIQDKLIHLERDDKELRNEIDDLRNEVEAGKAARKGVHSQLFAMVCSIGASVAATLILFAMKIGG